MSKRYKKGKYKKSSKATYKYPNVTSAFGDHPLNKKLRDYGVSHGTYFEWYIKDSIVKDIFEIHEIFLDSFGRDFVDTSLALGIVSHRDIEGSNSFKFAFNLKLPDEDNNERIYTSIGSSVMVGELVFEDTGKDRVVVSTLMNFYSDYPKNKETGEIIDLSEYGQKNRKRFNEGLKKFVNELEGEIYDYYPNLESGRDKDLAHKLMGEEINKKGFKSLSDRKDQLRKQEKGVFGKLFG